MIGRNWIWLGFGNVWTFKNWRWFKEDKEKGRWKFSPNLFASTHVDSFFGVTSTPWPWPMFHPNWMFLLDFTVLLARRYQSLDAGRDIFSVHPPNDSQTWQFRQFQESGCGSLVQATYRSLETSVDVDSQWIVRWRVLGDVSKLPADSEMCPARWKASTVILDLFGKTRDSQDRARSYPPNHTLIISDHPLMDVCGCALCRTLGLRTYFTCGPQELQGWSSRSLVEKLLLVRFCKYQACISHQSHIFSV